MSLTSVLANLDSSGSGKPGNPSYLGSVLSAFCRDSYKPHACIQCQFVKKGGYQFIYLYFSLQKNFMFMVKSYLMREYVFHNGKQYWKKQVRVIVREFCLMSGQELVLSGHTRSKPVVLKMGCHSVNVLWFCHMNTNCRQQEIL